MLTAEVVAKLEGFTTSIFWCVTFAVCFYEQIT